MQGAAVAVELHRPAAIPLPAAGVVDVGDVHPRPRPSQLPRPDVLGQPSARLGPRVELAAAAVSDGRLQIPAAVGRRSRRVTAHWGREFDQDLALSEDADRSSREPVLEGA